MHIDGNWMFGTTRAAERDVSGSSIYVWLLDLDAEGNPRVDNLQIRQLDSNAFPGPSHITGVKPQKLGEQIHMIYFQAAVDQLYYLLVDFPSGAVISTLLYINVKDITETAFIGNAVMNVNGIYTFQSYSVGHANQFETNSNAISYRSENGVVLATVRDA